MIRFDCKQPKFIATECLEVKTHKNDYEKGKKKTNKKRSNEFNEKSKYLQYCPLILLYFYCSKDYRNQCDCTVF